MTQLEMLRAAARARGVPIRRLWLDQDASMRFDAYETRRCEGMFSSFSKPFYPVLLRWETDDGLRQMMKVEPVINGSDRFPREDWIKTGEKFLRDLTAAVEL